MIVYSKISIPGSPMTTPQQKNLPAAAIRALKEAEERRAAEKAKQLPNEINGRKGPEATRFGDWEKNGIISDF